MPKFHTLTIQDIRQETPDCVSIAFAVPEELGAEYAYQPGQFLTIKTVMDGTEIRRSYSICSSPVDGEWRIAVKQIPGGVFSTFANAKLQVGDTLEVMTPMGHFGDALARNGKPHHYVGVAAGSGITPIMSILRTTLATDPTSRFTLFLGNRGTDSIIFRETLEGLKNQYLERLSIHHVLSREHPGSDLFYGRIDADKCAVFFGKLLNPHTVDAYFLCGPEEMIHTVTDVLQQSGVERSKIHFELFTTGLSNVKPRRAEPSAVSGLQTAVTIKLDGNSFDFQMDAHQESILDAALRAGADLPYACKGGVCCTCRAKITAGEVDLVLNYGLEPDELEAGYVLTCQSYPKTTQVTVDFDA